MSKHLKRNIAIMLTIFTIGGPLSNLSFADEPTSLKYSTETIMVDKTPIKEKSSVREALAGFTTTKAAPVNSSKIDLSWWLVPQTVSALATSNSTVLEDSIKARARLYKYGGLVASGTNEEKKSKYAGRSVTYSSNRSGTEAYGNHEYKLAGYKDVYHETYDSF